MKARPITQRTEHKMAHDVSRMEMRQGCDCKASASNVLKNVDGMQGRFPVDADNGSK